MKLIQSLLICATTFAGFACTSQPQETTLPSSPQSQKTHTEMSFDDLAQIGLYLQSANSCSLPQEKLSAMTTVYRAFVDEKYSEEQEIYLKKTLKEKVKYWDQKCDVNCSCDIYIGFSEYLQSFNFLLSATEKSILEKLEAKAKIDSGARIACMNRAPWVCGSRVLRDIRRKVEK